MATTQKRARCVELVQDIEDVPGRLRNDYRRHQKGYHAFTPEEVSMGMGFAIVYRVF